MKKAVSYISFFILAYVVFVVATIPATFVLQQASLPKNIQINQVSGSIWHFKAKSVVVENEVIHNLDGTVNFLSFLSLTPSANITFGQAAKPGLKGNLTVVTNGEKLEVKGAKVTLAANDILKKFPLPFPLEANGNLVANVEHYEFAQPFCAKLAANVQWKSAEILVKNDIISLGDYQAKVSCENGAIVATLNDKNNLGLSYNAYLQPNGQFSSDGSLKPTESFPNKLKPLLPLLGKPDNQGRYRLML